MTFDKMPMSVFDYPREVIKLACGCELTKRELEWMWENGVRYIVKQKSLYEIGYSVNYQPHFYSRKIFTFAEPQTLIGRCWYLTASEVNTSYAKDGVPTLIEE